MKDKNQRIRRALYVGNDWSCTHGKTQLLPDGRNITPEAAIHDVMVVHDGAELQKSHEKKKTSFLDGD